MHDAHAVQEFTKGLVTHLQKRCHIEHVVIFSDGAASQFKSKRPFAHVAAAEEQLGVKLSRCFFGSRHGKGPCDGLGASIKSMARRAVLGGQAQITNAAEFANFAKKKMANAEPTGCQHKREVCYTFFLYHKPSSYNLNYFFFNAYQIIQMLTFNRNYRFCELCHCNKWIHFVSFSPLIKG